MSRRSAVIFVPVLIMLAPGIPVNAQKVYGPADLASEPDTGAPVPLQEPKRCDQEVREDGAIVVCRELPEAERYMSPLPRPLEVHVNDVGGLREPPCWVTGKTPCTRFGSVPPYPPMIDTTAFAEQLSEQDAAAVYAIETDAPAAPVTGKRVPIDLSGDDQAVNAVSR